MAYAVRDDVLARAGRFAGLFAVVGKRPNEADLDELLEDVSSLIDAEILGRGYDPDLLSPAIVGSLRDVTAWATLVRALVQAAPGDDAVEELVGQGTKIIEAAGFPGLAGGSSDVFGALAAISAGEGGGGPRSSAGSLWDEIAEPEDTWTEEERGEAALPFWRRGQAG